MKPLLLILIAITPFLSGCKQKKTHAVSSTENVMVSVPKFSVDSAYRYIQKQVDFGPRVPNTKPHANCATYLTHKLRNFGAEVTVQEADVTAFDGTILHAKNIIASYNPNLKERVLLFAHWDTRPWADHDNNMANHNKPILGANDAASGVGILLEMARQFQQQPPNVGVDIILFDAEDYGAPDKYASAETSDSWCLGSQYWANNKHRPNYRAKYGILLDMVGAKNATFYRESISDYYAKYLVDHIWQYAAALGFGNYFINESGGWITDDHLYVNKIAGIPAIDIIQYSPNTDTGFGHFWHTMNDNMDIIDKNTIQAVATTIMHVVYNETP